MLHNPWVNCKSWGTLRIPARVGSMCALPGTGFQSNNKSTGCMYEKTTGTGLMEKLGLLRIINSNEDHYWLMLILGKRQYTVLTDGIRSDIRLQILSDGPKDSANQPIAEFLRSIFRLVRASSSQERSTPSSIFSNTGPVRQLSLSFARQCVGNITFLRSSCKSYASEAQW